MATKRSVWNQALIDLGHRRLSDTGEAIEVARDLAAMWDQTVLECLKVGSWNFAMETIKAVADTGVTPEFGAFTEVFAKPSDWLRTTAVSLDENFSQPLLHYYDDDVFWSAASSPLYIRYVSSDTGLGFDLNRWPPGFARFVELEIAERLCLKITQDRKLKADLGVQRDRARRTALNHDAMDEANPKFPPPGSWTAARGGGSRERGSRNNLTG